MKELQKRLLSIVTTLALVALAITLGRMLWGRYMDTPWTRDGRVRADVVNVASDVAGLVTEVAVRDNQFVHRGDLLFRVDDVHYLHVLAQAQAVVDELRLMLQMKRGQATRRIALDDQVISRENREDTDLLAASAKAEYAAAQAQLDQAKLNVERTVVRSPVDGWVSNLLIRPGDFTQIGVAKRVMVKSGVWPIFSMMRQAASFC
jgi:multidrug resistance efflux pump